VETAPTTDGSARSAISVPVRAIGRVRRRFLTVALVGAAILTSSCQAAMEVDVDVADDGSGVVEAAVILDAEATAGLRDLDENATGIPLEDLAEAGWQTQPPTQTPDGGTRIEASKAFGNPPQLVEVLEELGGEDGIFRDFSLTREQSFGQLAYSLTGRLDVSEGLDAFVDPDLEQTLASEAQTAQSVAEYYGVSEQDISVVLNATMPGQLQNDASNGALVASESSVTSSWRRTARDNEISVALSTTRRSTLAQESAPPPDPTGGTGAG